MKKKDVTIEEVAKAAGVSTATISRVINNKSNVTSHTRDRVLDAMHELGYRLPDQQVLSSPDSTAILVCLPDLRNPFSSEVVEGIRTVAHRDGYHIIVLQSNDYYTRIEDFIPIFRQLSLAGILILSPVAEKDRQLLSDLSFRCPVVMCSEYAENYGISYVSINDDAAARKAVSYLYATGCRKIGLLNSPLKFKYARHRESGYRQILRECSLQEDESWIAHIPAIQYDAAYAAAMHILQLPDRPDSFFCCSDLYGIAAVNAAKNLGLTVPDDVSVVGFDNVDFARMSSPELTTIAQPMYQMGFQACGLLIEKIQSPSYIDRQIILGTELIIRNSTKLPL